jgi:hypothetical protein
VWFLTKWFVNVAEKAQIGPPTQVSLYDGADDGVGGSMPNVYRTAEVREDAIVAFLLFCLEIYQAEQQRKRKLH